MKPPTNRASLISALLDSAGRNASRITTPASFAALVVILFCVVILMSQDEKMGAARPWLMGLMLFAGICMLPRLAAKPQEKSERGNDSATVELDDHQTKQFLELYQYALAYNISREIDERLRALQTDPASYDREFFCNRIWAITLKCRQLSSGFSNLKVGKFRHYFEVRFPEAELRTFIVEKLEPLLLRSSVDPVVKRKNLFDSIENLQRRFHAELVMLLDGAATKRQRSEDDAQLPRNP